jgi:hypothetical protein
MVYMQEVATIGGDGVEGAKVLSFETAERVQVKGGREGGEKAQVQGRWQLARVR